MKAYADFIELVKEYYDVSSVEMLLDWDQETYMPPEGVKDRSLQLATLSKVAHEMLTSDRMASLIKELGTAAVHDALTTEQQANVRRAEWEYHRAAAIPSSFVKEMAKKKSEAFHQWTKSRAKSDFASFAPYLFKLVEMKKQEAEYIGYEDRPYDALLDGYERGLKVSKLEPLFSELANGLSSMVGRIRDSGTEPDTSFITCGYPIEDQKKFCRRLTDFISFNYERGRMDEAPHPFAAGTLHDTRIPVRYYPEDPRPAFFSALHEGGHALYEQGFIEEHYGTPMGQAVSLGIHESQSRLVENIIGRSLPFWKHWYPALADTFPKQLEGRSVEEWYAAVNDVRPSLIRVESDEVTYNLHIIIRFELEDAIFSGKLDPKDAPQAWDEHMEKYLGVKVPDSANGILQDIHWSQAYFGYFPTYTLGNLYSAQFYDTMKKDMPDMDQQLERGEFAPTLQWLRDNIHKKGGMYEAEELVEEVTGEPPSHEPFMAYLENKFGGLYGI